MADPNHNFALLGDSPVLEAGRGDHLDFDKTAQVLAGAAVQTKDPLTIGVFGEWGSGKTSLMRLIKRVVEKDYRDVVPVWFNAWQYEREEHLIVPLVATITKELGERRWVKKAAREGAEALAKALRSIAYGFSVKGKIGIPLISEAEVNLSTKEVIEGFRETSKEALLERSLYFDAFEKLAQLANADERSRARTKPPRLAVFVDDLDRCDPERAVELLEHIKLVLHQPGFAFVLGVHAEIVEAVIRAKYKKNYDLDTEFAKDYLHKFAQVRVYVPKRDSPEMTGYIGSLLDEAGITFAGTERDDAIPLIADACGHNPRSVVRMLNGLIVTSKIAELEDADKAQEKRRSISLVALVIDVATRELEWFREVLEYAVNEEVVTIGSYLAAQLQVHTGDDAGWLATQMALAEELRCPALVDALSALRKHRNLLRPLQSEVGQRWLQEKSFRDSLGEARRRTGGEPEEESSRSSSAGPIQELLRNMVHIGSGTFKMGSRKGSLHEKPVHEVALEAFEMSATLVTQAQYAAVMGENPSHFRGDRKPVEHVSWNDAMEFCEKLSNMTGQRFSLPTEAQWEYACRAGTTTDYCDPKGLEQYAWYDGNSGNSTHPVGEKKPNPWGLFDMHGNVWEWCADWYGEYDAQSQHNPPGPDFGPGRVLRGGSWNHNASHCCSAYRFYDLPDYRSLSLGFRVARIP